MSERGERRNGGNGSNQYRRRTEEQQSDGPNVAPTLRELGISGDDSSRWQRLADIPQEEFERLLDEAEIPSTEAILRRAGRFRFRCRRDETAVRPGRGRRGPKPSLLGGRPAQRPSLSLDGQFHRTPVSALSILTSVLDHCVPLMDERLDSLPEDEILNLSRKLDKVLGLLQQSRIRRKLEHFPVR